jgi:hypothetical protein
VGKEKRKVVQCVREEEHREDRVEKLYRSSVKCVALLSESVEALLVNVSNSIVGAGNRDLNYCCLVCYKQQRYI